MLSDPGAFVHERVGIAPRPLARTRTEITWISAPDVLRLGSHTVIAFDRLTEDERGATYTLCDDFFKGCTFRDFKYGTIKARSLKGRGDHYHYHEERLSVVFHSPPRSAEAFSL
jgi:hypothetical protein